MREAQAKNIYLKNYQEPDFLIDKTYLDVRLFDSETYIFSRLKLRRNPKSTHKNAALFLHGQELELLSLSLNGERLSAEHYAVNDEGLMVSNVPDSFELESEVRIFPQRNTSLEGLYKSSNKFCTQCEAEGFRKITWYLDRPDVLSSFSTRIEADRQKYPVLLSNGNLIDSGDCPDANKAGRHWVVWEDPFKKPSYLFALVAGDLQAVEDTFITLSGREVKLQIFVEKKDLDKCDFAMRSLKKAMTWDEKVYGREYDLDIFMIVAVDDFNMGAMENKGLNIFNSSCVLAKAETSTDFSFQKIEAIVAHEYFHNWSGNRVTCRDWFQLSLKEGFTVYRDAEFSADVGSRAVKRIDDVNFLRTVQFAEDAGPMAHSVRPESYMEISNFYTVTIYEKGAEVVRMLANLLGPDNFRQGTDLYFDSYDGMAVTTEDFVACMEQVSGLDLTQFRRWYTQAGTPHLKVSASYDADGKTYTLRIEQSCPPTPGQPQKEAFYIPFAMALLDAKGKEIPLFLEGAELPELHPIGLSTVLTLKDRVNTFVFTNISEKPIPSLLRSFSAPVKMSMEYTLEELMFLMSHDSDGFVRWESSQQLYLQIIHDCMQHRIEGKNPQVDKQLLQAMERVLKTALQDHGIDRAMISRLLLLPSEAYIGELTSEIDVDGIHETREHVRQHIALSLEKPLAELFQLMQDEGPYRVESSDIARRALKNTVLNYLVLLSDEWLEVAYLQYQTANNMTDQSAGLRALLAGKSEKALALKESAYAEFYQRWQHEPLVIEQWLSMQAGVSEKENLSEVILLTQHESFDIKNPNKVRSVIGSFSHQNIVGFHHESGSGYRFLSDKVIELNRINPQIAARLLTPLTQWHKHQANRQSLMKSELERISREKKLSSDVYEVVSKSMQQTDSS